MKIQKGQLVTLTPEAIKKLSAGLTVTSRFGKTVGVKVDGFGVISIHEKMLVPALILHKQSGMADIKHEFDPLNCVLCHRYEMLRLKLKEDIDMARKNKLWIANVTSTIPTHDGDFEAGSHIFVEAQTEHKARIKAWDEEACAVGASDGENEDAGRRRVEVNEVREIQPEHVAVMALYFPHHIDKQVAARYAKRVVHNETK